MITRIFILLAGSLAFTLNASAAYQGTTADDLPHRDRAIHWPKAFDPGNALVFSHNELLIHASCHRVFSRLADVTDWPNWFVLTKEVQLDRHGAVVEHNTLMHLKIFGSPISTKIDEFVPDSRLSWYPQGLDETEPHHYHTWHLLPESDGCRVVTEETGIGPDDAKRAKQGYNTMHRAHDLWLASLRWTSEQ